MIERRKVGKPDIWMPLYVADYLADTQHLTTAHHGAYLLLLMAAWMRGGRLPVDDDQLAAICRTDRRSWLKIKPVLADFFVVEDGALVQGRLRREYEQAQSVSNRNKENGKKGGRPRNPEKTQTITQPETQTEPNSEAKPNPEKTPSPTQANQIQKLSSADADLPPGFTKFWEAWPRGDRKQGKKGCLSIWKAKKLEAVASEIIAHVEHMKNSENWRSGFDPMPETYLRKQRWDGADMRGTVRRVAL